MRRLQVEFWLLYVVAPLAMALLVPPRALFPALFAVTAAGLLLLARTPGFEWSDLVRGVRRIGWGRVAALALVTGLAGWAVLALTGAGLFGLLRVNPGLMAMIVVLYPFLSALPQEILYRALFFRRYGALLPQGAGAQVWLNAGLFAYAHLMYWSALVAVMTFAGGLVFAHAYRVRGNFAEAVVLHSAAGVVVFTIGLGAFFYSGNITRPF